MTEEAGASAPLVLVHSPALGPATWDPLAAELRRRGCAVLVPSLLGVADGPSPVWPRVVTAVVTAVPGDAERAVLVVHSNAGLFVPVIAEELGDRLVGVVFVDAGVPGRGATTPLAPPGRLASLRALAGADGLLPPWTRWWTDDEAGALFPDAATRRRVQAEEPRLPLAYYEQDVPAQGRWRSVSAGYVGYGEAYAGEAERARRTGWPVRVLPGLHLHHLVDPAAVADAVLAVTAELTATGT